MKLVFTTKRVWDDNPDLKKRKSLHEPPDGFTHHQLDQLVRWVFYFVDPLDSPHYRETDFDFKKRQSITSAGVDDPEVLRAINDFGKYPGRGAQWVGIVIRDYLSITNVTKWSLWVSLKKCFGEVQTLLLKNLTEDDGDYKAAKAKLAMIGVGSVMELGGELSKLESELFSLKEVNDLMSEDLDDTLGGFAELMADDPA